MKYFTLILATFSLFSSPVASQSQKPIFSSPVWMIEQEFVKLGKNEAYKIAKKDWLAKFEQNTSPDVPYMIAAEEPDSNQFLYLFPMQSINGVEELKKRYTAFRRALPAGERLVQEQLLDSLINFKICSLHNYKEELSYASGSFINTPYIHYAIYTLSPGTEEAFEQCLIRNVSDALQKKDRISWRVWKTLFGGDLPKYIICFFAASKEALKIPDIVEPGLEMAIRKKKEGNVVLTPALSLTNISGDFKRLP